MILRLILLGVCLPGVMGPTPVPNDTAVADPFRVLDLIVETNQPLAAYQIELVDQTHTAKIVGIEGNGSLPFQNPPFYDPTAMAGDRVILGAFSTVSGDQLPKGKVRVARVMVQIGAEPPRWTIELTAAATVDGWPIEANLSLTEGKQTP